MEITRANQNKPSTLLTQPSTCFGPEEKKEREIMKLLTKLNVRRQARLGTPDLVIYAEDLMGFEVQDIEAAVNDLTSKPRADGETAFPETAVLLGAVKTANLRRCPPRDPYLAQLDAWEAERKANPEGFINLRTDPEFQTLLKRHGIDASALIEKP